MEKIEDRRIRKTKEILKTSLLELMQMKSMNKISVKELVTLADLNRSTFYNYYYDVPDMVAKIEQELYDEISHVIDNHIRSDHTNDTLPVRSLAFIEDLCIVIKRNSLLCKGIFSEYGDISFLFRIEELIEHNTHDYLAPLLQKKGTNLPYIYSFFRSGCLGLLKRWMNDGFIESPEEIAKMTYELGRSVIITLS